MDIVLDLTPIMQFLTLSPGEMMLRLLVLFGWIPVSITFLYGAKEMWLYYINVQWGSDIKYVFLAIDIPRNNMQSPKAVENLFTYLAGAHASLNLIEAYWEGVYQLAFSFEIVSIDGYTQFIIQTPDKFRNLVETAVYSNYPDAEITEVDDYTKDTPTKFPDEEYECWGTEYVQKNNDMYPIKTYQEFEHQFGEADTYFRDPMASLMDLCSSLNKGEQIWFQIIIVPTDFDWVKKGELEISHILKEKVKSKTTIIDYIHNFAFWIISEITGDTEAAESKSDDPLKMINLKPGDKEKVEAVQLKISKLGFYAKLRMVYMAKKEVMNKPKVANGFTGYIKQFINLNLNNLKPDTKLTMTTANYFFKKARLNAKRTRVVRNFKNRDAYAGRTPGIFTIDELATLWHFPISSVVKAPLIQKTEGRKIEPPMTLPFSDTTRKQEELFVDDFRDIINDSEVRPSQKKAVKTEPSNFHKDILEDSQENNVLDNKETKLINKSKDEPPSNLPFV